MAAQIFGLDIGRSFIKVIQLKAQRSNYLLTAAGSLVTPPGGMQTEAPLDLKKVSDAVKSCVDTAKIEGRKCVASLVESQTVTRLIQMPNLTDKELSASINWEAEQYIPLPLKEVSLQYTVVSRPQTGSGGKMDVLLVAAPKRLIEKYQKVVKDAGLELSAIESESSALGRVFGSEGSSVILISLGAVSTELVLLKGKSVVFTRSIATGGMAITKAVMAEFNLPQNQAEEYKIAYGILEDKLSGKVSAVIRPILEVLVSEVLKALDFSRGHLEEISPSRIIICGGGAYMPGLSEFLTQRTSLEVSLGDPWFPFVKEGLILKMPGYGSFYAVSTGLAMRS